VTTRLQSAAQRSTKLGAGLPLNERKAILGHGVSHGLNPSSTFTGSAHSSHSAVGGLVLDS